MEIRSNLNIKVLYVENFQIKYLIKSHLEIMISIPLSVVKSPSLKHACCYLSTIYLCYNKKKYKNE